MFESFDEDPDIGHAETPEYLEELYEMYKSLGWNPEDLTDEEHRQGYATWLEKQAE